MTLKFYDKLSRDFTDLLDDKEEYNVIIEVGKEPNKKSFTAHSAILRYRSSYFRKELSKAIANESQIKTIIKPNISAEFFEIILKYTYGGVAYLEDADERFIFDLMIIAEEIELDELFRQLELYLIQKKSSWLKSHFLFIYRSVYEKSSFQNLEKFCHTIVSKHPDLIFDAVDFTSLKEPALVSLLKRDDLEIAEVKIWEKIIMWGVAQQKNWSPHPDDWPKENFGILKSTLQNCLPHIRYFHLSDVEIWEKVKPYRKVIDKQLWEDLQQHLLFPDRPVVSVILPPRIKTTPSLEPPLKVEASFSTIINNEHAAEIASWVDRKNQINARNIPYEFQLILRGSRDGFDPQTFWNICHGHTKTVVVLKVRVTDEILGGYNPLAWDKTTEGSWIKTNDSFIFSLKNKNLRNSILSRVNNPGCAVWCANRPLQRTLGPCFGNSELRICTKASDFSKDKQSYCHSSCYYEKHIRSTIEEFSTVEYEVFKLNLKL